MKCYWLKKAKAINCNSNMIIPFEKAKTTHIGGKAICLRNWYLSLELLMLNEATCVPVQHKHNNNTLKKTFCTANAISTTTAAKKKHIQRFRITRIYAYMYINKIYLQY